MNLAGKITLESGFVFNYAGMLGTPIITEEKVILLQDKVNKAIDGLEHIRKVGIAKGHLSKDGTPENVLFTKMPFVKKGNPNTPTSISELKEFGVYLREEVDAVIFLGVGGSYLGNKILFDIFAGKGWNVGCDERRKSQPRIYFSGNSLDVDQYEETLQELQYLAQQKSKRETFKLMLVPISKSGTTLETLAAFNYFYERCQSLRGVKLEVTVVTDTSDTGSPLCILAKEHSWRSFDIKEGIGGRFCIFSDPGLVTAVAIGMDIDAFLLGAKDMEIACQESSVENNPALLNATLKYLAFTSGVDIEVFMPYVFKMKSVGEWYVQLLAESLGKREDRDGNIIHYGRTPVAAVGSTDMHAQTQQHQDGKRDKIIQFVEVEKRGSNIALKNQFPQIESLKKYEGLVVDAALKIALEANEEALSSDKRLNAKYILPQLNEYYLGQLLYFLMLSIAYEGELANVDAYDQPGVEIYKRIMKTKMSK